MVHRHAGPHVAECFGGVGGGREFLVFVLFQLTFRQRLQHISNRLISYTIICLRQIINLRFTFLHYLLLNHHQFLFFHHICAIKIVDHFIHKNTTLLLQNLPPLPNHPPMPQRHKLTLLIKFHLLIQRQIQLITHKFPCFQTI